MSKHLHTVLFANRSHLSGGIPDLQKPSVPTELNPPEDSVYKNSIVTTVGILALESHFYSPL